MAADETFIVKKITVDAGKSLHLQTHDHRREVWTIVRGTAEVTLGREQFLKTRDDIVLIPVREFHRIANVGKEPLVFIEVQTGDLLSEADIVHYDDDYRPVK